MPQKNGVEFLDFAPGTQTATFTGASKKFYGREALWSMSVHTVSGTTPVLVLELQSSIDGGTTWITIEAKRATQSGDADWSQEIVPGEDVRVIGTITGTTPSFVIKSTLTGIGS